MLAELLVASCSLQNALRSIEAELGTEEPGLIEICAEGIATVLEQIEASGDPSGGRS